MTMDAVEAKGLTKVYRLYSSPKDRLKEWASLGRWKRHQEFYALRNVDFAVAAGQTVGIVGANGSGKSTLLQLIAGVLRPSGGGVRVRGRVSSLLELGAGFSPEFTGRENVYMNGALMGYGREEMARRFPVIEEFAEIGRFIDQPVKTYSSGMYVRLAFACAINVDPDVLIVDEALAVGDAVFQHRCMSKIKELQRRGMTILLVSHDTAAIKALCRSALLLDRGELVCSSDPETVINLYHARIASQRVAARHGENGAGALGGPAPSNPVYREDSEFGGKSKLFRHGSGAARVTNVELLDARGAPAEQFAFNQEAVLRVHIRFLEDADFSILGYYFRDKNGLEVIGTNTFEEQKPLPPMKAGGTLVVDFVQRLPLAQGTYSVVVALAYHDNDPRYLDWVDNARVIRVAPPADKKIHSKVWLPVAIHIHQ